MKGLVPFIVIIAAVLFVTCSKDKGYKEGQFNGPETAMGLGVARAWVNLENISKPKSIGFTLTSEALEHLPDSAQVHNPISHSLEFVLEIPNVGSNIPFKHIVIDWNPIGHMPGPYKSPHFDCHFYLISSEERALIPDYKSDSLKFKNQPSLAYLPANYFMAPGGEPKMGSHWVDSLAPELKGQPFTESFIYGSYNGKVNFIEPMVTYAFLKNIKYFSRIIPRPEKVQISGYYPGKLHIAKKGSDYIVTLDNMEFRNAQ